ncbi:MAG: glycosyltransferase family 2 protein, partial [Pyrinomonadaceae bacterium]
SHKIFRYAVPVFLLFIFAASMFLALHQIFFAAVLALQILFYGMAFLAWMLEKNNLRIGILALPLYFVLTNLASLIGFYKFLRGERYARWEPIRESGEEVQST